MAQGYRELIVWQKAMDLVEMVYKTTQYFPKEEMYGLTSQLRRAIVSVPSNIAEGQARKSAQQFAYHLSIALGSLKEAETQILIAQRLNYIPDQQTSELIAFSSEVGRLINGLYKSLANKKTT